MNRMFALFLLNLTVSGAALAGVKVTSLDLSTKGNSGLVNIVLNGRTNDLPDIKVSGRIIEVTLVNADAFMAINKNVKGAHLSANSQNGKAIVKLIMPYEIAENAVEVGFKNSNIEVIFPRGKVVPEKKLILTELSVPSKEIKKVLQTESKVLKEGLDEDYLNKLMTDETSAKAAVAAEAKADEISLKQAATTQVATPVPVKAVAVPKAATSSDNFSFAGYAAKFTFFLALILGLFYGLVQLLKKGVFTKGKLSFLNNTKMIEVLSTTYIAPKRSLMIVKAHKQIFLVANSESGFTFLSEMTDTSGLMKEGEKQVLGTNFDTNLSSEEDKEEMEMLVKLKENILESTPHKEVSGLSKIAVAKDIVKFSDELKKKAKKLKPIEFN